MQKLFVWLFSKTAAGSYLNSKKTYVGALLLVFSGLLKILESLLPLFPDVAGLGDVFREGSAAFEALTQTLDQVGLGILGLGLAHKAVKEQEAKEVTE